MSSHPTTLTLVLQRPRLRGAWPNTCHPTHLERLEQSASLPQVLACAAPRAVSSPIFEGVGGAQVAGSIQRPAPPLQLSAFSRICVKHIDTKHRRGGALLQILPIQSGLAALGGRGGREEGRCGGGCYCFGNSWCSSAALPSHFPPMSVVLNSK